MNKNRNQRAIRATQIGIVANLALAIVKGIGGVLGNSRALIADAVHSASDVISSIAVMAGIKAAERPPDAEHPYGHGKSENVATLIVSIMLILVGFEILLNSGSQLINGVGNEQTKLYVLFIVIFSIIVKESLFQYKNHLGKKLNSQALVADAWHHRSDAISSIVALFGIGVTIIGNYYNVDALKYFDPIAGVIIALIIMWMGYDLARDAASMTLESVLDEDEAKVYVDEIQQIDGVRRVDNLYARTHGSYFIIDTYISVDANITVDAGHEIAHEVEERLEAKYDEVMHVLVHVNPYH